MDYVAILAQATTSSGAEGVSIPVERIWQQTVSLNLVEALTFISFGAVCLLYGWRVFRILVTICFALLGLLLGVWANKLIGGNVMWLSIICMVVRCRSQHVGFRLVEGQRKPIPRRDSELR